MLTELKREKERKEANNSKMIIFYAQELTSLSFCKKKKKLKAYLQWR